MAERAPLVWALIGDKAGDTAQLRVLAEALGWPVREIALDTNGWRNVPNVLLGASLLSTSLSFAPPWPDVVLWTGRRGTPIARWIRRASGHRARLVNLGRPWAPYRAIDLVVGMPQYRPPQRHNVLAARLPLNRIPVDSASGDRVVLVIGGPAPPLAFGAAQARRIGADARALAERLDMPLVAVTSRRTSEAILGALGVRVAEAGYRATLATAARIIVTGDSASMIADALSTGRPVDIAPLPFARTPLALAMRALDAMLSNVVMRFGQEAGLCERPRDMPSLWRALFTGGHVGLLGGEEPSPRVPAPDDLPQVLARIRSLC